MAQAARLNLRMQKELKLLLADPPPGVFLPMLSDETTDLSLIHAQIQGPEGTVYADGIFSIKIQIPDRYPFQPPNVTFATPIYHPNIDNGGRICLDILNLPPKGAWQPSLNISTVLTSIGLLLSEPNPDDGLMCEASREYKYNRQMFDQKARSMTEKYANRSPISGTSSGIGSTPPNSTSSKMEVERTDTEFKTVNTEEDGSHQKLTRVSRKLSLESSAPSHGSNTAHSHKSPILHRQRLSLASPGGHRSHQENISKLKNSSSVSLEQYDNRKKLLESSAPVLGTDSQDNVNVVNTHSSLRHSKTLSLAASKSSLQLVADPVDQQFNRDGEKNAFDDGGISLSHKKLSESGQKLSVIFSCSPQKKTGDENTCKLSFSRSKLSLVSSNSSLLQDLNYDKPLTHRVDDVSMKTPTKKPLGMNKKVLVGASDKLKTGDDDNKENVPPNYQLTPKSHSLASTKMPQVCSDHVLGATNGSTYVDHKKISGLGRKLSLGSSGSFKGRENTDTQNVLPIKKPLPQTQSLHSVSSKSHDDEQEQQLHGNNVAGKAKDDNMKKNLEEVSPEAVIVLDSEDSEEEAKVPVRSKLSISRKRLAGKRKVKA